jgi:Bacterial Ig domain
MTREPTGPGCARRSGPGPSVTLSASASDAKGAARVDFYVGSQMVGTDSTAGGTSGQEYSASLNSTTLPEGPTTVVARAYDAAGNEKVSASRSMIVDNASPTGSVLINGGRASTTRLAARLNLEASDATSGTPFVRIANTSARLSTARWEALRGDQGVEAEREGVEDQDRVRAVQGRGGQRLWGGLRHHQVPQISGR